MCSTFIKLTINKQTEWKSSRILTEPFERCVVLYLANGFLPSSLHHTFSKLLIAKQYPCRSWWLPPPNISICTFLSRPPSKLENAHRHKYYSLATFKHTNQGGSGEGWISKDCIRSCERILWLVGQQSLLSVLSTTLNFSNIAPFQPLFSNTHFQKHN